jgi:hypothetical protein
MAIKCTLYIFILTSFLSAFLVRPVWAHGFGERYELPVPLELYLIGSGLAIIFSFAIMGLFLRRDISISSYPIYNVLSLPGFGIITNKVCMVAIRLISLSVFALVIISGLFGTQEPDANMAPTMVWIIVWVGLAYVSALFGNIWSLINPWKIAYEYFEAICVRTKLDQYLLKNLEYPDIGIWPAVLLFVGFSWVELIYPYASTPMNLAILLLIYSVITWTGMLVFGKDIWIRKGEIFSIVFGVFARFSPTEVGVRDSKSICTHEEKQANDGSLNCLECFSNAGSKQRFLNIRPPSIGLIKDDAIHTSEVFLIMVILSNVTFDGFMATGTWYDITENAYGLIPNMTILTTLGLICCILVFTLVYFTFCRAISLASGASFSDISIAKSFVYSLIPIAIAYHLAHFLSFLLIQGQLVIPLFSDPFGYGWNIFGTADYIVNIAIVDAKFAWIVSIASIVVGHIIAVYLAHVIAVRKFATYSTALRSQLPMLILMVSYTVISLWILAQPIVELD